MPFRSRIKSLVAVAAIGAVVLVGYWVMQSPSAEELLGVPLPPTAEVIHTADKAGMFGGDYYAVIKMPESDFVGLVQKIGMTHRPDLFGKWPSALEAPGDITWWEVMDINDASTFFSDQQHSTYVVARYERGRMYYKVHVY